MLSPNIYIASGCLHTDMNRVDLAYPQSLYKLDDTTYNKNDNIITSFLKGLSNGALVRPLNKWIFFSKNSALNFPKWSSVKRKKLQ